jgi:hypothetical protein
MNTYIESLATRNVAHSEKRIEQKESRAIRSAILDAMQTAISNAVASDNAHVVRTADGIVIAIDNADAGFISIAIDATVKGLDYDADTEAEDYADELKAKVEKATKAAAAKAARIAKTKGAK